MKKNILFVAAWLLLSACGAQPVQTTSDSEELVLDALAVRIYYDDTPGFLYPVMRHDVDFSVRMRTPGRIDFYQYKSQDAFGQLALEFFNNGTSEKPLKFRSRFWSEELTPAGSLRSYVFTLVYKTEGGERQMKEIEREISVLPAPGDYLPVSNSRQLLGEPESNYSLIGCSADGKQVYYLKQKPGQEGYWLARAAIDAGQEELLFTVEYSDAVVLDAEADVVLLKPMHSEALLIRHNLSTGERDSLRLADEIDALSMCDLPGTGQMAALAKQKNSTETVRATLIDLASGELTYLTSVELPVGNVERLALIPESTELALQIENDDRIFAMDYTTKAVRTLAAEGSLYGVQILDPQGRMVVTRSRPQEESITLSTIDHANLYLKQGAEGEWLSHYPGRDSQPLLVPGGTALIFVARRRGHSGIWALELK